LILIEKKGGKLDRGGGDWFRGERRKKRAAAGGT